MKLCELIYNYYFHILISLKQLYFFSYEIYIWDGVYGMSAFYCRNMFINNICIQRKRIQYIRNDYCIVTSNAYIYWCLLCVGFPFLYTYTKDIRHGLPTEDKKQQQQILQ